MKSDKVMIFSITEIKDKLETLIFYITITPLFIQSPYAAQKTTEI